MRKLPSRLVLLSLLYSMWSIKQIDSLYLTYFEFLRSLSIDILKYRIETHITTRTQSIEQSLPKIIDGKVYSGHNFMKFKPGEGYTGRYHTYIYIFIFV